MAGDSYLISDQQGIHFLTFTVVGWLDVFTRKEFNDEIVDSLNYCVSNKNLKIYSWCLMSNHLHLVCRAAFPIKLSDVIRDYKKFTSKKITSMIESGMVFESKRDWLLNMFTYAGRNLPKIKKYKFWKDANHAIYIYSPKFYHQKMAYVHLNPVNAGLVDQPEDWVYSSARDYGGRKGLVELSWDE